MEKLMIGEHIFKCIKWWRQEIGTTKIKRKMAEWNIIEMR
jgi:hypothetical protein